MCLNAATPADDSVDDRPLLTVAELEALPWQCMTHDDLMDGISMPHALRPLMLKNLGPYPYPFSQELRHLCDAIGHDCLPDDVPTECPECSAGVVLGVGKRVNRVGMNICWCQYFQSKDLTKRCNYHAVLLQKGGREPALRGVFEQRVKDAKAECTQWLEEHNPANLPLPQTEEAATEWMIRNGHIPDKDEAPKPPSPKKRGRGSTTPASSQSGWSTVCATPSPLKSAPPKTPGSSHTGTPFQTPTPSPRKRAVPKKKELELEDLRDVFKNHVTPPPSTQPSARWSLPAFREQSPGNMLVPGTPEDEVIVLSDTESLEEESKPEPKPKRRKLIAEVVLPLRGKPAGSRERVRAAQRAPAPGHMSASAAALEWRRGGPAASGTASTSAAPTASSSKGKAKALPTFEAGARPAVQAFMMAAPAGNWLLVRVVVWKRRIPCTVYHMLRSLEYRGHELEVAGLLYDSNGVEIYDRSTDSFVHFDRTATYRLQSPRETIILRTEGVEEMIGFASMVQDW